MNENEKHVYDEITKMIESDSANFRQIELLLGKLYRAGYQKGYDDRSKLAIQDIKDIGL